MERTLRELCVQLPRNTRLIYPHSYQSMVWNTMASRRIATFGLKPMVGDLVLPPGAATDMDATDTDNMEQGTGRVKQRNWQQYSVVFNFDVLGV